MCFVFHENDSDFERCIINKNINNSIRDSSLVLSLNEETAKSVELSGGKGSSLSQLMHLKDKLTAEKSENNFDVPNGIVVTTNAYKALLLETNLEQKIVDLEKLAFSQSRDNLKSKCEELVDLISKHKLPQSIRIREITQNMLNINHLFIHKSIELQNSIIEKRFHKISYNYVLNTFTINSYIGFDCFHFKIAYIPYRRC